MGRFLSLLTALCAIAGLALHFRTADRDARRAMFLYYTNLSNLLTAAYQLARLSGLFPALERPGVRLAMMLCILVTGVVYWTLLAPGARRRDEPQLTGFVSSLLLHGVVPALGVLEWALFADRAVTNADALRALALPAAYGAFILLRAWLLGPIPGRTSPYPYHFLNLDRLGPARFLLVAAALLLGFWLLGLAAVGFARLPG